MSKDIHLDKGELWEHIRHAVGAGRSLSEMEITEHFKHVRLDKDDLLEISRYSERTAEMWLSRIKEPRDVPEFKQNVSAEERARTIDLEEMRNQRVLKRSPFLSLDAEVRGVCDRYRDDLRRERGEEPIG